MSHDADLSLALFAARILREHTLAFPMHPADKAEVARRARALGGGGALGDATLIQVTRIAERDPDRVTVTLEDVRRLGSGRPAAADGLADALGALNAPALIEGESPVVRAFLAAHALLPLVGARLAAAVEALLLHREGFDVTRLPLPPVPEPDQARDPFLRDRADAHVAILADAHELVADAVRRRLADAAAGANYEFGEGSVFSPDDASGI